MKKMKLLVPVLVIFLCAQGLSAIQADITLNFPYYMGIHSDDADVGDALDIAILIPDVRLTHYFGDETLKFGVGVRLFTVLLESMIFPIVSVESEIGRLVLNANIGGGVFMFFGILNSFEAGSIFIPEASVAFKVNEWFRIGTGVDLLIAPEIADISSFAFVGTVFARFTIK